MATDNGGVVDSVLAELNPDPDAGPDPDAKGPDPAEWDEDVVANRDNSGFVPSGEGDEPKGPDPDQWGADARETRGAVGEGVQTDDLDDDG